MSKLQKADSIAVIIAFLVGGTFFGLSYGVFKNLDANCPSSTLRNGWAIIQALGACMMIGSIAYFLCVTKGQCYQNIETIRTGEIYTAMFGVFFLIILGISGAMIKDYKSLKNPQDPNAQCDDKSKTTYTSTISVLSLSAMGLLLTIGYFVRLRYNETKELLLSQ